MIGLQIVAYGFGAVCGAVAGLVLSQQAFWLAARWAHSRKAETPGTLDG